MNEDRLTGQAAVDAMPARTSEDHADMPRAAACGARPYPAGSEGDDGTECTLLPGHHGPHDDDAALLSPEDPAGLPRVRVILPAPGPEGYLLALDRAAGTATVRFDTGAVGVLDAARLQYADRSAASGGGL